MSVDAIVVGGGHNGLAAAAVLAKSGRRTVVLEARDEPGGLCAGAEFHPGYRHAGVHLDTDALRPWVIEHLGLESHGLGSVLRPPLLAAVPVGLAPAGGLVLPDDPQHIGADLTESGQADAWRRWRALVHQLRPVVAELLDHPSPRIDAGAPILPLIQRAFGVRRAGVPLLRELMRLVPGSVEDALADRLPEPRMRAAVALGPLLGAFMGPKSPQSAGLVLLREALGERWVPGGPARLVRALLAAGKASRAEVRCGAVVERIRVEQGRVAGVILRGGEAVDAGLVVSAIGPKRTLLDLLAPRDRLPELEDVGRAVRVRATHATLHLALSRAPRWSGREGVERVRVAFDPVQIERAFDCAKHGRLPENPPLDIVVPTEGDPTLAPPGHHVLTIGVFGVPYQPAGGWDGARKKLVDTVVELLARFDPELPSAVVGHELLDPPTIEARYGAPGGHVMHGEHALDQLWVMRPGFGLGGHATPIRGLFLGSGGTHPYGWVSGSPGVFAARRAIEEPGVRG